MTEAPDCICGHPAFGHDEDGMCASPDCGCFQYAPDDEEDDTTELDFDH